MADLDRVVAGLRCRDVLKLLPDYVDGELASHILARVNEHLRGCDRCEKFGGEYADLVRSLRSDLGREGMTANIRDRLDQRMAIAWRLDGRPGSVSDGDA